MSYCFRPIIFFDSGLGGLTIVREARIILPEYYFVYVIDNAAFPYGEWKEDALRTRLLTLFSQIINKYNPLLCIIACNTASTLALADLRIAFPFCSFIGTVPAIRSATRHTRSGLVSVLATPATIRCAYTQKLTILYAKQCRVHLVKSKKLASIAEEYLCRKDINLLSIKEEILSCFVEHEEKYTDIVVLACTHYPFLINFFRQVAPWPVDWLDPSPAIVQHTRSLLAGKEQMKRIFIEEPQDLALFTAYDSKKSVKNLMQGFHFKCEIFDFP